MREEEKAYLAGLMDGDGALGLAKRTKGSKNPMYYPHIQCGFAFREMSEYLRSIAGGSLIVLRSGRGNDGINRRDFFRWQLQKSGRCLPFLETIRDHLAIKKEQANILINFIHDNPFIRGYQGLSWDVLQRRERDYLAMKKLNSGKNPNGTLHLPTKVMKEDPSIWAYFAGLMDTDGSFSIKKEKPSGGRTSPPYSPMLLLTMNDVRGINKIRSVCPFGSVFLVKAKTCKTGFTYRFGIYSKKDLLQVIPRLIPFLRLKKSQAECLLAFCEKDMSVMNRRKGVDEHTIQFRENMYLRMLELNQYGVYKPSLIDLEAQKQGNKGEGESHAERLNERGAGDSACESLITTNSLEGKS